MSKIPFDIKYRSQIESGEYKVETRNGWPARIICWDKKGAVKQPLIVLIEGCGGETVIYTTVTGEHVGGTCRNDLDLFIVTPDEELTPFEDRLAEIIVSSQGLCTFDACKAKAKSYAAELLAIAREELFANDTVLKEYAQVSREQSKIEAMRTHATELTENLIKSGLDKDSIPYHLIEFMCNLYDCPNWKEIEETAELYVARIKAAAMKDLPRWEKCVSSFVYGNVDNGVLFYKYRYIHLSDLEKLPGFKED